MSHGNESGRELPWERSTWQGLGARKGHSHKQRAFRLLPSCPSGPSPQPLSSYVPFIHSLLSVSHILMYAFIQSSMRLLSES